MEYIAVITVCNKDGGIIATRYNRWRGSCEQQDLERIIKEFVLEGQWNDEGVFKKIANQYGYSIEVFRCEKEKSFVCKPS